MGEVARYSVGSTVVVEFPPGSGRTVLVQEPKKNYTWNKPGGKNDLMADGTLETIFKCGEREVLEECGLIVRVTHILGVDFIEDEQKQQFALIAQPIGGELKTSEEHPRIITPTLGEIEILMQQGSLRSPRVLSRITQYFNKNYIKIDDFVKYRSSDPYPENNNQTYSDKNRKRFFR
jgi:ADP-ribose pyrophosphatase YjhB (NUDIX family)